ncbi:MAG: 3-phosphoglycerate dehydrogenase family protein [Johnsonella sp.]|nr:3-phosphoglycerate dehydrogenase family protein [Johnsonella sp.]
MKMLHCLNSIAREGREVFGEGYAFGERMEEAQGLLLRSASLHEQSFSENLLAIARAGAGVNNIPIERCSEGGIVVFNTPGANANSVKELVICAMLLVARDVIGGIQWLKSLRVAEDIAKEVEKGKKAFAGHEIKDKRLGVIGLGAIGAEVANAAVSLGMEVYGYDPYLSVNAAWRLSRRIIHINELHKIYEECDYISLHAPLTKESETMIDRAAIQKIKEGAVVLNFSRDRLVDDEAMAEALESGKIRKYITDFPNEKSMGMKNCIAIPHLGASTEESEINCAMMAARQMKDYLENGNIQNSVNFADCDMGICKSACRIGLLHLNIPNMLGQITAILAQHKLNITDMTNKSRDKYAYTLLDLDSEIGDELLELLEGIEGMKKVRKIC